MLGFVASTQPTTD